MNNNGWTITFLPWESEDCLERVAGRFKTTEERDKFIEDIHKPDSGWLPEELESIAIYNDYNYRLPR